MTGSVKQPWLELLFGAVIVAGLTLAAVFAFRKVGARGGLIHGYDKRVSTSRTVVYVWTALVAWIVATEALVAIFGDPTLTPKDGKAAAASFGAWMKHVFDDAESHELYLVFLGGPYAAAVFAQIAVSTRTAAGTLQKSDGSDTHLTDAVRNDDGAVDPVDFQFVLFNLLIALSAAMAFALNVGDGLPTLADFLAILTGGSALTYTVNKGISGSGPALTAIHPQAARVGDRVTVFGRNLKVITASSDKPKVTVAGVAATIVEQEARDDQITFLVPSPAAGTAWSPGQLETVIVTTAAGLTAQLESALAIALDEPVLQRLEPSSVLVSAAEDYPQITLSLYGQYLATPGATNGTAGAARVEITDTKARSTASTDAALEDDHLTFALPASLAVPQTGETRAFTVNVARGGSGGKRPVDLFVALTAAPVLESLTEVRAEPGEVLPDVEITATGRGFEAPASVAGGPGVAASPPALEAQLPGGAARIATTVENDTTLTFTLPAGETAPATGDRTLDVTLFRGVVSSNAVPLKLVARADPSLTAFTQNGDLVTATGTEFGPAPESRLVHTVPAPLHVRLSSSGETFEAELIGDPTETSLVFRLPDAIAPGATVEVAVTRAERAPATGQFVRESSV